MVDSIDHIEDLLTNEGVVTVHIQDDIAGFAIVSDYDVSISQRTRPVDIFDDCYSVAETQKVLPYLLEQLHAGLISGDIIDHKDLVVRVVLLVEGVKIELPGLA